MQLNEQFNAQRRRDARIAGGSLLLACALAVIAGHLGMTRIEVVIIFALTALGLPLLF